MEKGQHYHYIISSELVIGIIPKFLRQHILLTLTLRVFGPGAQVIVGVDCENDNSIRRTEKETQIYRTVF